VTTDPQTNSDRPRSPEGIVVGVGSSAGGLPALKELLVGLPSDPRITVVLVQHQAPDRRSALVELLGRVTDRDVIVVEDGSSPTPGAVHVAARTLEFVDDAFVVDNDALHVSIDRFFRSLAQTYGDRAVGVLLSGSGSDGTAGLLAVKRDGGLTLVQDPATAAHDGMPTSALRHGAADIVGSPTIIAERLGDHAAGGRPLSLELADDPASPAWRQILELLRERTGHDFTEYKPGTMHRRVARRMAIHRVSDVQDYLLVLRGDPEESDALFSELLIGVTRFFRDAAAFDELRVGIRESLREPGRTAPFRVWVPGCATGEEAYSVAMLIADLREADGVDVPVTIFGTDIDQRAVDVARAGRFSPGQLDDLPPAFVEKHFAPAGGALKVRPPIRDMLIFATQSLVADPPFMHLDLISCRNVLIYLNQELQEQLTPLLHYALEPGGLLFLGSSEGIGSHRDLFDPLTPGSRVFKKIEADRPRPLRLPAPHAAQWQSTRSGSRAPSTSAAAQFRKTLLADLPPSVIIDGRGQVVFVHGRTGQFLEPATGVAGLGLLAMARRGLRGPLATALRRLEDGQTDVVIPNVSVRVERGDPLWIDLRARSAPDADASADHVVISFIPCVEPGAPHTDGQTTASPDRMAQLEAELDETRQQLEGVLAALKTSTEELQSSNEELQSANEELQSANEELETSREETLSLNEELRTVNAELEARVSVMARATDDLVNLLDATGVATVFVDRDLAVRRFTESAQTIIHLIDRDVDRPLRDIQTELLDADLVACAATTLETIAEVEREVRSRGGRWYKLRLAPYRTLDGTLDGVVITLVDMTRSKRLQLAADAVLTNVDEPHLALDAQGRIQAATAGCTTLFGRDVPLGAALDDAGQAGVEMSRVVQAIERLPPGEATVAEGTDVNGRALAADVRHMARDGNHDDTVLVSFRPTRGTA
jgi:two-component system CheB/CheR fusion protein